MLVAWGDTADDDEASEEEDAAVASWPEVNQIQMMSH